MKKAGLLFLLGGLTALLLPLIFACAPAATPTPPPAAPTPTKVAPLVATPTPTPAASPTPAPKRGGVLKYRQYTVPPNFDVHQQLSWGTQQVSSLVNSQLLRPGYGPTLGLFELAPFQPDLAERWEQKDPVTYVFYLRKGAKFHNRPPANGREVTADDVVYSYNRGRTQKLNPFKDKFDWISDVKALDKYTVQITTKDVFAPALPGVFAHTGGVILAKEVGGPEEDWRKAETLLGSGPFMFKEYVAGQKTVLVRNPDYYKAPLPYLDGVEIYHITDAATARSAFRTGALDDFGRTDTVDLPEISAVPDVVIREAKGRTTPTIYIRTDMPPFDDVRVRRAMSLAINRQEMIDKYYKGKASIIVSTIEPYLVEWLPDISKLPEDARHYSMDYNPTEAKQLLAEAGYPTGLKGIPIQATPIYGFLYTDVLPMVQSYLLAIGIETKTEPKEYGAWIASCVQGECGPLSLGYTVHMTDVDDPLYRLFHPSSVNWKQNRSNDPELVKMVEEQRKIIDFAQRKELVDRISVRLARMLYYVHTPSPYSWWASHSYVKNYYPKDLRQYTLIPMEAYWLDK